MKTITLPATEAALIAAGLRWIVAMPALPPWSLCGERLAIHTDARPELEADLARLLKEYVGTAGKKIVRRGMKRQLPLNRIVATAAVFGATRNGNGGWLWRLTAVKRMEPPHFVRRAGWGIWEWTPAALPPRRHTVRR